MSVRLLVLVSALSLGAPSARPARDTIEIRWQAPPSCPNETSVRVAVERHVGRPLSEIRDRRLSIIATAHPTESHWSLTIFTVTTEGTQERSIRYAHGCAPLAEAAAVLIAMTIDPQVLGRLDADTLELITNEATVPPPDEPPAAPPEPSPTPPADPPPEPPASAPVTPVPLPAPNPPTPTRARAKPRGAARLTGSLGWGDLPSIGGGLGLAVAMRLGRFQAELTGGGWLLRRVNFDADGSQAAVFNLWSLGARAGYVASAGRRLEFPLVLGFEAGQIHVRGVQLIGSTDPRSLWFAVVVSPGLAVVPREFLAIGINLDLLIPVTRPRFVVENASEIFRPQPVGLRGVLGLEFRFPYRRSRSR